MDDVKDKDKPEDRQGAVYKIKWTIKLNLLLSWVMLTVSSITKNTGRYVMRFFYIPVNFSFNLPRYVTSYMHHTGKKESKKEIVKKEKKIKLRKICFKGIRTRTLRIS